MSWPESSCWAAISICQYLRLNHEPGATLWEYSFLYATSLHSNCQNIKKSKHNRTIMTNRTSKSQTGSSYICKYRINDIRVPSTLDFWIEDGFFYIKIKRASSQFASLHQTITKQKEPIQTTGYREKKNKSLDTLGKLITTQNRKQDGFLETEN